MIPGAHDQKKLCHVCHYAAAETVADRILDASVVPMILQHCSALFRSCRGNSGVIQTWFISFDTDEKRRIIPLQR